MLSQKPEGGASYCILEFLYTTNRRYKRSTNTSSNGQFSLGRKSIVYGNLKVHRRLAAEETARINAINSCVRTGHRVNNKKNTQLKDYIKLKRYDK